MGKHHINLRNNLEDLRKASGLTQQELSEAAEVSRKSINAIENGIYVPSTVLALKIEPILIYGSVLSFRASRHCSCRVCAALD